MKKLIQNLYQQMVGLGVTALSSIWLWWINYLTKEMIIAISIPFVVLFGLLIWLRLDFIKHLEEEKRIAEEKLKEEKRIAEEITRLETLLMILFEKDGSAFKEEEKLNFLMNLRPEQALELHNNKLLADQMRLEFKNQQLRNIGYL